ncbi:MAG: dihydroorotase [Magnetococcus sp. WYHC-3]
MSAKDKLLIKGGRLLDPASNRDETADLLIVDGLVAEWGKLTASGQTEVIDADGLIVAPGLVDMHVHLREPGFEWKETILGGSQAAVAGGVTSMACMPNTNPTCDDVSVVSHILEKARQAALARVFPIGAITRGLKGERITEMGLLTQAGCVGFSDDGMPVMNSLVMRRALEYSKTFGALIIQHAEDHHLSQSGCMNEGVIATRLGLPGIPAASETIMVERDIQLAEITGGRYHVAHISTGAAVKAVRRAQKRGLPVSAEAAPHHFALTEEAVLGYDTHAKMSPPLRTQADREAVLEGLHRGDITVIATDHAPHEPDAKRTEFCCAANGVVGLETLLAVSLELVRDKVMTLSECLAAMTIHPARLLRLPAGIGTLEVGAPADVVLFDPEERWRVEASQLHGTSKNTCFQGRRVQGRVKRTLLAGRTVYRDA